MNRRDFLKGIVAGTAIAVIPASILAWTQPQTPTRIVIAASDSSASTKRKADVVTDGHNDARVIQTAMNQVSARGGIVYMSSGTFQISP